MLKNLFFAMLCLCSSFLLCANNRENDQKTIVGDQKFLITSQEECYDYLVDKKGNIRIDSNCKLNYLCLMVGTATFVVYYDDETLIDKVKIKGLSDIEPIYGMYDQENVFYDDTKACHFELPFLKNNSEATVSYTKTYNNLFMLHVIALANNYQTLSHKVRINVPDWMRIELSLHNGSVNITIDTLRDESKQMTCYLVQVNNQPRIPNEKFSTSFVYNQPYLTITPKESNINGTHTDYFNSMDNLYKWHKDKLKNVQNDEIPIKAKMLEITANCQNDEEKIGALSKWVRQNIRYVLFADGISAFKPDDAQNVLNNRYGDCKGMSNLLKMLLVTAGFDARLAWVSTGDDERKDLDPDHPRLFANHVICALIHKGTTYYLDATCKSLTFPETPSSIRGRYTIIEDNEKHILATIPEYDTRYNRDSLCISYSIVGGTLSGNAVRHFRGEMKDILYYDALYSRKTELKNHLEEFLKNGEKQNQIAEIVTNGVEEAKPEVSISYKINKKTALSSYNNQTYVSLNENNNLMYHKINIATRKLPYKLPVIDHTVMSAELEIPANCRPGALPAPFSVNRPNYAFQISWSHEGNKVILRRSVTILNKILQKEDFEQWNNDILALSKAGNNMIVLENK